MSIKILVVFVFFVYAVQLGTSYSLSNLFRIVRGQKTGIERHPYMVSIGKVVGLGKLKWNDPHFCGASIITPKCVLSAAHCFEDEKKEWLLVHAGRTRTYDPSKTRSVVDIIMPKEQIDGTLFLDVAIVKLNASLEGPNIGAIELDLEEQVKAGDVVSVAGWGHTDAYMMRPRHMDESDGQESEEEEEPDNVTTFNPLITIEKKPSLDDTLEIVKSGEELTVATRWQRAQPARTHLHDISISVVDQRSCQRTMTELGEPPVTKHMFCAFGENKEDACDGDSGGPVVRDGKQVGIVSWGSGCGYYPGVYTRLQAKRVADFIKQTIEQKC